MAEPRLERLESVKRRIGLCVSSIYDGMKKGTFPRNFPISKQARAWNADEIDSWIADRIPNRRASERFQINHDGTDYLVTVTKFADGAPAEIFLDCFKPNSALAVHANDSAVLASLLLQHGVSSDTIRHSISGPIATALVKIGGES